MQHFAKIKNDADAVIKPLEKIVTLGLPLGGTYPV